MQAPLMLLLPDPAVVAMTAPSVLFKLKSMSTVCDKWLKTVETDEPMSHPAEVVSIQAVFVKRHIESAVKLLGHSDSPLLNRDKASRVLVEILTAVRRFVDGTLDVCYPHRLPRNFTNRDFDIRASMKKLVRYAYRIAGTAHSMASEIGMASPSFCDLFFVAIEIPYPPKLKARERSNRSKRFARDVEKARRRKASAKKMPAEFEARALEEGISSSSDGAARLYAAAIKLGVPPRYIFEELSEPLIRTKSCDEDVEMADQ